MLHTVFVCVIEFLVSAIGEYSVDCSELLDPFSGKMLVDTVLGHMDSAIATLKITIMKYAFDLHSRKSCCFQQKSIEALITERIFSVWPMLILFFVFFCGILYCFLFA